MHDLAGLGSLTTVRTTLAFVVALLLLATGFKWLRLRSPDGEHWAWLLLVVQGAMFASLTMYSPDDWFPPAPLTTAPAAVMPLPVEAPPGNPHSAPRAVPLRLDVPTRTFDRRSPPVDASLDRPRDQPQLACLP